MRRVIINSVSGGRYPIGLPGHSIDLYSMDAGRQQR